MGEIRKIAIAMAIVMATAIAMLSLTVLFPVKAAAQDLTQAAVYTDAETVRADISGSFAGGVLEAGDRMACASQTLELFYNEETSILKVRDKRNGYVWTSGQQRAETEELSRRWKNFSHCLVSADFIDASTMTTAVYHPDFDTQETVWLSDGFEVRLKFERLECALTVRISLKEDCLTVEIPKEQFVMEEENMILSKLYVLPFFGAAMPQDGDGYLFVPDGSGALIRFDRAMAGIGAYTGRIYGEDPSLVGIGAGTQSKGGTMQPDGMTASLPVYGIVHGNCQNAVLCEVDGGAEYCEIVASPAGNVIDWYWIAPHFIYNELYYQQDNTGTGFVMAQSESNVMDASFTMKFLAGEDADYSGMARYYRQKLLSDGTLQKREKDTDDKIPLLLDCLMGESRNNGFYNEGVVLTRLSDLEKWDELLEQYGVGPVLYSLRGASRGGYSRQKMEDFSIWKKLGSEAELKKLQEKGMRLIWQKDFLTAFGGQAEKYTYAYGINRGFIQKESYGYLDDVTYYVGLEKAEDIAEAVEEGTLSSLAVAALPGQLFSDYKTGRQCSRTQAGERIGQLLAGLQESRETLLLQTPNVYALPYADAAYDIPVSHSGFLCETDTIPFMEMVLAGNMDLYAQSNYVVRKEDPRLLRLIDYNVYPQFTVTAAASSALAKTNSGLRVLSDFESLAPDLAEIYQTVNQVLAPVRGAAAVSRRVPQENVAVTTYDNGWSVIVNYSDSEYVQGNTVTAPRSAVSVRSDSLQGERGRR